MRILLCFCLILSICSCHSKKVLSAKKSHFSWDTFGSQFLLTHSFQKSAPKHSKNSIFNKVEIKESADVNYDDYLYSNEVLFRLKRNGPFMMETYDNKYLLISQTPSPNGASSMELTRRVKIIIISFGENPSAYEVVLKNSIQLTYHKYFLTKFWKGSSTPMYAIDNITENTLVLLDTNLKYHLLDLIPYEGTLILEE
jgi:hypothetical protein